VATLVTGCAMQTTKATSENRTVTTNLITGIADGIIPCAEEIAARVRERAGVVLILGPDLTADDVEALLRVQVTLQERDDSLSLTAAQRMDDPLLTEVIWTSAPQVHERFELASSASDLLPLVLGFEDDSLVLGDQKGQCGPHLCTHPLT